MDTEAATEIVESLVKRETPLIWEVNGKRRVLNTALSMRDKTLVLLHADGGQVSEADIASWVEHSNPAVYRRDVLRMAHKSRLVEYDQSRGTVQISPRGIEHVEDTLLSSLT